MNANDWNNFWSKLMEFLVNFLRLANCWSFNDFIQCIWLISQLIEHSVSIPSNGQRERVNQCHSFACHLVHLCLNCDKRFEECVYILTCSWPTHDRISIKWNNTTSTITTTTTRRGKKETINMRFLWYHHNIKCHTWIRCEGIIWWQRRCTQAIGLDCFVL